MRVPHVGAVPNEVAFRVVPEQGEGRCEGLRGIGGAGCLEHFHAALVDGRADAVLAASLFHFGIHTVAEAKDYLAERGVQARR